MQRLKNEDGEWVDWKCGLHDMVRDYFQQLFTENQTKVDEVLNCVPRTISDQQNEELQAPVTEKEVREALFCMHPDKAPGTDGMTPAFFQKTD